MIETEQSTPNIDALEPLLDLDEVAEYFGVVRETICRKVAAGKFPQPIRLGRRITRWEVSTIRNWMAAGCPIQNKEQRQ